jgi:hypothetical protein
MAREFYKVEQPTMNKKQKANADFIKKIQSLSISTGSKSSAPSGEPLCPACGGTFEEHVKKVSAGIVGFLHHHRKRRTHDESHEESFAA